MDIRLSGDNRGRLEVLNRDNRGNIIPLDSYSSDELQSLIDTSSSVTIYLKDESRADEAKSLLTEFFAHFNGVIKSKATKYGWYVGQTLNPSRDDSSAFAKLRQSQAM
jgi:hypothetical protein